MMDKFLINMAVVKVNWDKSQGDILDNYIPMIAHTLGKMESDTFSVEEFKETFRSVAEFDIPTGAIITLLKRATKKYGYLERKEHGTYGINRVRTEHNDFVKNRETEQRKYQQLKKSFIRFCEEEYDLHLDKDEVDDYFFEVLFDIAPHLFANVSDIDKTKIEPTEKRKYLIGKFISYANSADQASFEAIVSFVRGAMLTETFYYSHPSDIQSKMRKVKVFFDTQFLLRALGYADAAMVTPCAELLDMLQGMSVKLRCFKQTFNEIHKILFAAASRLRQHGRLISKRPGDAFDHFARAKFTVSDVEVELAKLEANLGAIGVLVEEKPEYEEYYSIQESRLSEEINKEIPYQHEESRQHDIDCLAAIHRLRFGKPQSYLEACTAIFVTTNSGIARASTRFFNVEYGPSNAPVCMADQVFTTLIWLKAVKKAPDMPKDRLVATCYAATLPSEELWEKYVSEAEKLRLRGTIKEEDYAVLIHSLEARNRLMDLTFGENALIQGTLEDVLASAKAIYVAEVTEALNREMANNRLQKGRIELIASRLGSATRQGVLYTTLLAWFGALVFALLRTSPDDLAWEKLFSPETWLFITLVLITILNLVFGYRVKDLCYSIAKWSEVKVRSFVESVFSA
jgi:hypothetical protein